MVNLYSKFENLSEEKRKRILDACIEEFSRHSYQNASTNSIVEKAGISKGLLFHYFGNKKNLYLYVFDYCIDCIWQYIMEKYEAELAGSETDVLEKIMKTGFIKIRAAYEKPMMYKVLFNAMYNCDQLREEIYDRYEKVYKKSVPWLLEGTDMSKFRKDIDKDKIIEFIFLALEGVSGKYTRIYQNMDADEILLNMERIAKEYYEYIDILKGGVYDKERG